MDRAISPRRGAGDQVIAWEPLGKTEVWTFDGTRCVLPNMKIDE